MATTDSVFQRALSTLLTEIFAGPPGQEAYLLNPGDPGLLRQLDTIDATAASTRPMPGKTTIAAHVDHLLFGLSILNRWAAGDANAWAGADWNASWQRGTVTEDQWRTLRDGLRLRLLLFLSAPPPSLRGVGREGHAGQRHDGNDPDLPRHGASSRAIRASYKPEEDATGQARVDNPPSPLPRPPLFH